MKHHVDIVPYLKGIVKRMESGKITVAGTASGNIGRFAFDGSIDDLHALYHTFLIPAAVRGEHHKGYLSRQQWGHMTVDEVIIYTDHPVHYFNLVYSET